MSQLPWRWRVAGLAAAYLMAAGLVAAVVLVALPDPGTAAAHSGTTPTVSATLAAAPTHLPNEAPGNTTGSSGALAATGPAGTHSDAGDALHGSTSARTPGTGSAAHPNRLQPGATHRGIATLRRADSDGSCGLDTTGDTMVATIDHLDYDGSEACGAYLLVRAASGASVTVQIVGECGACATGALSLSADAFAHLTAPIAGWVTVTWRLLSPNVSDSLAVRYRTGSNRSWCALQVLHHRNPIASLQLGSGSTWQELSRTGEDYFISPNGAGCGGSIRVTDIYGQHLILTGLRIKPGIVQESSRQFARH